MPVKAEVVAHALPMLVLASTQQEVQRRAQLRCPQGGRVAAVLVVVDRDSVLAAQRR